MAVSIRLHRCGMKNQPHFRIVAIDSRKAAKGKFIEVIGSYDPRKKDNKVTVNKERLEYWKKNGARLSETVSHLI
jgi:small subunit ribosomal protein S16